jgi:hypothetical protein
MSLRWAHDSFTMCQRKIPPALIHPNLYEMTKNTKGKKRHIHTYIHIERHEQTVRNQSYRDPQRQGRRQTKTTEKNGNKILLRNVSILWPLTVQLLIKPNCVLCSLHPSTLPCIHPFIEWTSFSGSAPVRAHLCGLCSALSVELGVDKNC